MQDYRQLEVWQDSHELTLDIYRLSMQFPADERFGLTTQLRRAALSIPSNIAEGAGRRTGGDFGRFLDMALGSTNEVEYQLILTLHLGLISESDAARFLDRIDHIRRRLMNLRKRLAT